MKYQGLLTILFVFLFTIGLLNLCTSINLYLYRKSSDSAEESSIVKKYQKLATKQLEVLKYKMI